MLSDQEFKELLEDLHSPDLSMRLATLQVMGQHPTKDTRVLPHLESLLNDTTPCIVAIPYHYGEIRWLAAYALAAERAAMGISEPVTLKNVVIPLDTQELAAIQKASNIPRGGGNIEGALKTFQTLRAMGKLPLYDLEL
jgi:hypothetical protein